MKNLDYIFDCVKSFLGLSEALSPLNVNEPKSWVSGDGSRVFDIKYPNKIHHAYYVPILLGKVKEPSDFDRWEQLIIKSLSDVNIRNAYKAYFNTLDTTHVRDAIKPSGGNWIRVGTNIAIDPMKSSIYVTVYDFNKHAKVIREFIKAREAFNKLPNIVIEDIKTGDNITVNTGEFLNLKR